MDTPTNAGVGSDTPRAIIVDTDGGVDDAAALWFLLQQPTIDIVAITIVWGNVDVDVACASVCRVLEANGRDDITVALGARAPFAEAPALDPATFIHGTDGLGESHRPAPAMRPSAEPAVDVIADIVSRRPGEVGLLTLGPLSTIADFVTRHPNLVADVERIVVMGGAARGPGNALPFGEANIAHDPGAAAAVVGAGWASPGTLVGLDVTNIATFSQDEFDLLATHRTAAAEFLDQPIRFYRTFGSTFSPPGECPSHDLLAAMVIADPSIVTTTDLPIEVDCSGGPAWGSTIVDLRQPLFERSGGESEQGLDGTSPTWSIALDVDVTRFRENVRRLFGDDQRNH